MQNRAFTLIETLIAVVIMLSAFVVLSMIEPGWNMRLKWIESKLNAANAASILAFEPFMDGANQIDLRNMVISKYQFLPDNIKTFTFDLACKIDVNKISKNDTNITVYTENIATSNGSLTIYRITK